MIFLFLLATAIAAVYLYLTWNFDYWVKRGIPSAKATVLLGSLPSVVLRKENLKYDFDKIYNEFKGKAPFVGVFQIRSPRLFLIKPEMVKEAMVKSFKSFHDNEFGEIFDKDSDPLFGRNPFFLKGEEWKEKRAEITPAFTTNRLKVMYPLIEEVQGHLVKFISEQIAAKTLPLEAREISTKYTVDVVAKAIYGIDARSFVDEKPAIREITRRLFTPDNDIILKMFVVGAIPFVKKLVNMRFTPLDIEQFLIKLMKDSIKYREDNKITRDDFLEYVIQLRDKKGLKEIDMAAHTISFLTDGTETSGITIAHVLYELGMNQQVQDKLRDEINAHSDKNGKIDFDVLNEMPYIDQVIHEALRMHPPAAFTSRRCTEECELECDGFKAKIEKDMNLYVPIHQLHSDPEYYENPDSFIPERFDPENGGYKKYQAQGVFLPFGDGPRVCLGQRFALLQSKAAVAAILRNFKITVNEKTAKKLVIDPKEFINVKTGGLWLDFTPIKN